MNNAEKNGIESYKGIFQGKHNDGRSVKKAIIDA